MKLEMLRPNRGFGTSYEIWKPDRVRDSEKGDTLIEVLLTLVIISLCVIAFLVAFTTSITASAKHRTFVSLDTVLRTVSENAQSQIELQVNPLFVSCATPSSYQNVNFGTPTGYNAQISSVSYWSGSSFVTQCTSGSTGPQLIDILVTNSLGISSSISIVVDDPAYIPSASGTSYQFSAAKNWPRCLPNLSIYSTAQTRFNPHSTQAQGTETPIPLRPGCLTNQSSTILAAPGISGIYETATYILSINSSNISKLNIRQPAKIKTAWV